MSQTRELSTKDKIIKAATELFSQNGYKASSVRAIASNVGIRESALYNHFANKEAIFLECTREIFSTPFGSEDVQTQALKGKTYLQNIATQYKLLAFDKQSETMFRLLLIELFSNEKLRKEFLEESHQDSLKKLSEAFFIMMQHSLIRSADPMLVAYEFLSTLFYIRFQVALLRFDHSSTTLLSTQFEKHVDFFWDSIKIIN